MLPRLQIRAINRILMKTWPLLKRLLRVDLMLFICPLKHLWLEGQAYRGAVCADNALRVVEQIICVDDANLCARRCSIGIAIRPNRGSIGLIGTMWSYLPEKAQILKHPANFVVASFGGIEVVEACLVVEGWDGASEVGGDAGVRVADKEGEVEAGEEVGGHDGWVVGLGLGVEGVRRL